MIKFSLFLAAFALNFSLFAQFEAGDKLIGGSISGGFSNNPNYWANGQEQSYRFGFSPNLQIWKNSRWSNGFLLNLGIDGSTQRYNPGLPSWEKNINRNYVMGAGYQLRRWYKPVFEGRLNFYNSFGANLTYGINQRIYQTFLPYNSSETTPTLSLNLNLTAGALVKLNDKWSLDFQLTPFYFNNNYNLKDKNFSQNGGLNLNNLGWQVGIFYKLGKTKK